MTTKLPSFIEDIEDFEESINILCHGDTGAGKNWLWGHLPRLVILAIEEGTISVKKAGIKGVKVIRCRRWSDIVRAYEWLRDNPDAFDWVMIDSITKAQALCIRDIMEKVVKANSARDPLIPSQGDHFKWQLSIKQLVMDFNELPQNTIWLARSMVKENPDGDEIIVPSIEGKDYGISAWVCGEMSLLCYLKKERKGKGEEAKTTRKLYTNEHPTYWCKDWYDVLPHIITFSDPSGVADKIVGLIQESSSDTRATKRAPAKKAAPKRTAATRNRKG
jgi:hypothetical protein